MAGGGAPKRSSHQPSRAHRWWWLATKWGRWLQGVLDDIGLKRLLDKREQLSFRSEMGRSPGICLCQMRRSPRP